MKSTVGCVQTPPIPFPFRVGEGMLAHRNEFIVLLCGSMSLDALTNSLLFFMCFGLIVFLVVFLVVLCDEHRTELAHSSVSGVLCCCI